MNVKGSLLKTRWEFLEQRQPPGARARVLAALPPEQSRAAASALSASWIPFHLVTKVDEIIVTQCGADDVRLCVEIGAFSARRNLTSLYHVFMEQAGGDPFRLLEHLAMLHGTLYDWGFSRAQRLGAHECMMEAEYGGGARRTNCLTALGFYREALRLIEVPGVLAEERACQAAGDPLCSVHLTWQAAP